jgi:VanZ family protein
MFLRYNLFGFCWLLLIMLLTLTPGNALPETSLWEELISFDKVVHFLLFCILVLLLIVGFKKQYTYDQVRSKAVPLAITIGVFYGVLIEVMQNFVDGRFMEFMDMVANTIGCGLGYGLFYLIYKW